MYAWVTYVKNILYISGLYTGKISTGTDTIGSWALGFVPGYVNIPSTTHIWELSIGKHISIDKELVASSSLNLFSSTSTQHFTVGRCGKKLRDWQYSNTSNMHQLYSSLLWKNIWNNTIWNDAFYSYTIIHICIYLYIFVYEKGAQTYLNYFV